MANTVHRIYDDNAQRILDLIQRDIGKPVNESVEEGRVHSVAFNACRIVAQPWHKAVEVEPRKDWECGICSVLLPKGKRMIKILGEVRRVYFNKSLGGAIRKLYEDRVAVCFKCKETLDFHAKSINTAPCYYCGEIYEMYGESNLIDHMRVHTEDARRVFQVEKSPA